MAKRRSLQPALENPRVSPKRESSLSLFGLTHFLWASRYSTSLENVLAPAAYLDASLALVTETVHRCCRAGSSRRSSCGNPDSPAGEAARARSRASSPSRGRMVVGWCLLPLRGDQQGEEGHRHDAQDHQQLEIVHIGDDRRLRVIDAVERGATGERRRGLTA